MTERPIYTTRLCGTGPTLLWDEERGVGCEWGTPASILRSPAADRFGHGIASLTAAHFFAKLNRWTLIRRAHHPNGVVADSFATPRGPAVVFHVQWPYPLDDPERDPNITVDQLPEPWVDAGSGERPYTGYVVRRVDP